jgi:hypothetical protein
MDWSGSGPQPLFSSTTAEGMQNKTATVTYTRPPLGDAQQESGYIHVFDAELTMDWLLDAEEGDPGTVMILSSSPRRRLYTKLVPEDMNSIFPYDMSQPQLMARWTVELEGGDEVEFYDAETGGNQLTGDDLTWGWEQDPQGPFFHEQDPPSEIWVQAVEAGECDITLTLKVEQTWHEVLTWYAIDKVHVVVLAEEPYTELSLRTVTFGGDTYRMIVRDDNLLNYAAPHWDVTRQVKSYPVAYTSVPAQVEGETEPARMEVGATIKATPAEAFVPCRIAGVGGGFEFVGTASAQGDILTLSAVPASKGLDEYKIDLLDPLAIDWSVSVDGGPWMYAGTSDNRIYVTWREPTVSPRLETLFWLSCKGAKGLGGEDAATHAPGIVTAIWGEFTDRNVKRVDDDEPMTYYKPEAGAAGSASEMLASENGNGGCLAWAQLLFGCMQAQGFASKPEQNPGGLEILEVYHVVADANANPNTSGFCVKHWKFAPHIRTGPGDDHRESPVLGDDEEAAPTGDNTPCILPGPNGDLNSTTAGNDVYQDGLDYAPPYPYVVGKDAREQPGMAGQGNTDPPYRFNEHYVCKISSVIYDPSYGLNPCSTEQAHENSLIDGIARMGFWLGGEGVEPCKKNSTEVQELDYDRDPTREGLYRP